MKSFQQRKMPPQRYGFSSASWIPNALHSLHHNDMVSEYAQSAKFSNIYPEILQVQVQEGANAPFLMQRLNLRRSNRIHSYSIEIAIFENFTVSEAPIQKHFHSPPALNSVVVSRPQLSRPQLSRPQLSRPQLSRPQLSRPL